MEDFKKVEKNVKSYKKYEKPGVDNDALKAKAPNPSDLVGDMPEKLHVAGPVGKTSAKKSAL